MFYTTSQTVPREDKEPKTYTINLVGKEVFRFEYWKFKIVFENGP